MEIIRRATTRTISIEAGKDAGKYQYRLRAFTIKKSGTLRFQETQYDPSLLQISPGRKRSRTMVIGLQRVFEINGADDRWMIQLGKLSLRAEKIILKNFTATPISMPYVKTILTQNNLYISSWEEDLILERHNRGPNHLSQ